LAEVTIANIPVREVAGYLWFVLSYGDDEDIEDMNISAYPCGKDDSSLVRRNIFVEEWNIGIRRIGRS